jgi:hypothetical protein
MLGKSLKLIDCHAFFAFVTDAAAAAGRRFARKLRFIQAFPASIPSAAAAAR